VSAVTFFKNASTNFDASAGAVQKKTVREQSRHCGGRQNKKYENGRRKKKK